MRYEGNIYRPPIEGDSYLLQCTIGCSNNKCTFCGMFKDKDFRIRKISDILDDIDMASEYMRRNSVTVRKAFLCDGDAIVMKQDHLLTIIKKLYNSFPELIQVNTYAGPKSTMTKSPFQIRVLKAGGLHRAYLGVETGSNDLLEKTKKGVDADQMLQAGLRIKEGGMELWAIILLGLGGTNDVAKVHIRETVKMLNAMKPEHVSAMTYMPVKGTEMYDDIQADRFKMLNEKEILEETKHLIQNIEVPIHFTSEHASSYLMLDGELPKDRDRLCTIIDDAFWGKTPIRGYRSRRL